MIKRNKGLFDSYLKFGIVLFVVVLLVVLINASVKVPVNSCVAEDEASQGSFGGGCDDSSGSYLLDDDSSFETHTCKKQSGSYAGVRVVYLNLSVTNCDSIDSVDFCYKWWADSSMQNCDISLDADEGVSYSLLTSDCPLTSEPGEVSCVDVSGLESWSCGDFFGASATGAYAKSELRKVGNGVGIVNWDVFFFNVSYSESEVVEEAAINESVEDAEGNEINVTLEIIDEETGEVVYNNTGNNGHGHKANKNKKYKIRIRPQNHKVREIEFSDVNLTQDLDQLVDIDDPSDNLNYNYIYAVNPVINISSDSKFNVTSVASEGSTALYKCADWNFTGRSCDGDWVFLKSITPGEEYFVQLTIADPGLAEGGGVFFDGFEDGSLSEWTLTINDSCANWFVSSNIDEDHLANSGSYFAEVAPDCHPSNDPGSRMEIDVDTTDYENITFSYYRRLHGLDGGDYFRVKWYNGTDWIVVEEVEDVPVHEPTYTFNSFSLDNSASDNSNFRIRFECTALTSGTEYCQVDDVQVSGDAMTPPDSTPPNLSIVSPENNLYSSDADLDVNYIVSGDAQACWWSNDTMSVNNSITCGENMTSVSWVEGQHNVSVWANDSAGNENVSSVVFYIDSVLPSVSGLTESPSDPVAYSSGAVYEFNASVTDSNLESVLLEFNGVNYTASNEVGDVYNVTLVDLAAGSFNYRWFVNDSAGNVNNTEEGSYTINKATPTGSVSGTASITYGTAGDVEGSESNSGDEDVAYNLFRDNVLVSNPDTIVLAAGSYDYIYNTTGGQNYSAVVSLDSFSLTVNQADPSGNMQIVITPSNNVDEGTQTSATASETNGGDVGMSYILHRNDVAVSNPNVVTLDPGVYNYTYNTTGGQNYSSGFVNATLTVNDVDNEAPEFSDYFEDPLNSSTYSSGGFYEFNVTITEANLDSVGIEFDGVNYTSVSNISNDYVFNRSDLAAGDYSYYWWANDTLGNYNTSGVRSYTVSKISSSVVLSFDSVSPQTYETTLNVSCSNSNAEANVLLYRDGVGVTSDELSKDVLLGAGSYDYVCNVSSTQNYSFAEDSDSFVISQADPVLTFLLNGVTDNVSLTYPQQVNVSASSDFGIVGLDRSGESVLSENGLNVTLGVGEYIYRANITGDQNYSDVGYSYYNVTINKASTTTTVGVDPVSPITYGTVSNFSCLNSEGLDIVLYVNSEDKYDEKGLEILRAAGDYNVNCSFEGNQNYSASSQQVDYTIDKETQTASLSFNESSGIIYGTYINVSCNGELYRDNLNVTGEISESVLLGVGSYDYSCQLYESQNYSYDDDNSTFVVNQAVGDVSLLLNGLGDNLIVQYPQQINASGSTLYGDLTLYRDSVDVNSENSENKTLSVGYYNYTAVSSGDQNYSSVSLTYWVNVTRADSQVFLYLNNFRDNVSISYGDIVEINSSLEDGEGDVIVYVDGSSIFYDSAPSYNLTIFENVGLFNVSVIYSATQNYTFSSETFWVDVVDNVAPVVSIVHPESKTYGVNSSLPLNFSVSDVSALDSCWYSLNGGNNVSVVDCQNTTFNVGDDGEYTLELFVKTEL
ncbi:hypothetical protein ACFL0X_00125 [Nanoarchaeota archaeon]